MSERAGDASPTGPDTLPALTVPATVDGLATALTYSGAGIAVTGPDRSHPDCRPHPPLVEFGEVSIPDEVSTSRPETDVTARLPADRATLFVAAPLVYYLGAHVELHDGPPTLVLPDREHEFSPLPAFQHEVATLLGDTFFLDGLVRELPSEADACLEDLLPSTGGCPYALASATPGERVAQYLDCDRGRVADERPEWHLATYTDQGDEEVRCLPYLLDAMSLVYLPQSSAIDAQGLLKHSLDDFYRARPEGDVASVDVLAPELHDGDLHAWLAEGVPVSAFTPSRAAYEHRLAASSGDHRTDDHLDVAVVLNDDRMSAEHDAVARTYRENADSFPARVSVHESLSTDELARVFEADHDFVHYIGHCEVSGLRCTDGGLDCSSLSESGARTFFLNACGSYHQGRTLVERGSVAGAVTIRTVLDEQAAAVGTAFARLLVRGFGIERAMRLARRQVLMSTDYAVVGDGTFALTPDTDPALLHVDPRSDGDYAVRYSVPAEGRVGGTFVAPFESCRRLRGTTASDTLDAEGTRALLADRQRPVIFDGDLRWSTDLAPVLDSAGR
ncbi:hypothetical protein [Halomarina oriensis]|uniref:CHAT domain-containing protein n=1 Tax=Halomarina oriensis TaxID=671145 RepID=A0A6B0GPE2_9EURY|nr:hypothetical protein [Halomarina oriensis]MWG36736.1 hypothetical protein [Halomarina oriensis]